MPRSFLGWQEVSLGVEGLGFREMSLGVEGLGG